MTPGTVTITQPMTIDFGNERVEFIFNDDITAQVERLPYEALIQLWNAREATSDIKSVASAPFMAAVTMRLMRGKSIGNVGAKLTIYEHYADSRKQSAAA